MNTSLSVQGTAVPESKSSRFTKFFSKKGLVKSLKVILPIAAVAAFFSRCRTGRWGKQGFNEVG